MLRFMISGVAALLMFASSAIAQQAFQSPEDAAAALAKAAKANDPKALASILGPDGNDIVWSGDEAEDAQTRQKFVAAYEAKHSILTQDNFATIVVGPDDFRVPIPLQRRNGMWRFDAEAGRDEIVARRIGANELAVIQACLAYVDAQNEYAEKDRTGAGAGVYAQRIVSRPGKKDGLYWPDAAGEEQSPLGELAAAAAGAGRNVGARRAPYHGYYFRILTRQGPSAPGGELDYVVGGKMIGGFALIAYPAEYRVSGVMTFMVNHAGAIFQKDLGPNTEVVAGRTSSFQPFNWTEVKDTALVK